MFDTSGPTLILSKTAFAFLGFLLTLQISAQSIWTIGPMLHINFSKGNKPSTSFSLECAYWNFNGFPYSIDFACEFEKERIRFYTEGQTGIGLLGVSVGPVLEYTKKSKKSHLGWQTTYWGNYFLGFDVRKRKINSASNWCIGTYVKTGFGARDENGNRNSSTNFNEYDSDYFDIF